MIAALYARVSTDEQANRENSIPAQIRALREYCKKNNITIYDEFIDEGISGQKSDRPSFQKMLKAAYDGKVNIILVHKFDRFARKIELSRKIKDGLRKSNVNVISITEPIEDNPMGFFMEGLYELMAEYYVKNLAVEVKKGMGERALKGKHTGQMPYGYYCKGGEVFVDEEQAEIIRQIYNWYIEGNGQFKIAKMLNERMIPTYSGLLGAWSSFQVRQILKNYKYIGKNEWDGQMYDIEIPHILDDDTFYRVNSIVLDKREKHTYRGDNFAKYSLLELLRCGNCGSPMRIKSNHERNNKITKKYACRAAIQYQKGCKFTKLFGAEKLENEIDEYLKSVMNGTVSDFNIVIDKPISLADIKEKQLQKITSELERAKNAYIGGVFELGEYKDIRKTLEVKKNKLEEELKVNEEVSEEIKRKSLADKLQSVWEVYQKAETPNEKRAVLQTIIKKIEVFRDRFEITFFI